MPAYYSSADANSIREVEVLGPNGAFGEIITADLIPRLQIDAVYGILETDHETFAATGGSTTVSSSMFVCNTGTSVGGYGVIRSRRLARYRPGQGLRIRFTSMFDRGVPNCFLMAGAFNSEDGLFVGYNGSSFGFLKRAPGSAHIARLTVTNGTSGAESLTVKLNGVDFVVTSSGVLSTSATAELIAESAGIFTGWSSSVSPTSNGSTVTFLQGQPAAPTGSFTFASNGTAAGTFATLRSGSANNNDLGFVTQSSWNVDKLDGTGQSGMILDPTKLNVYEMIIPYLGASAITLRVAGPSGQFITCHKIEYTNQNTVPSFQNPTFRVGWTAASLGSTSSLNVRGASAAAFTEGPLRDVRDPFGIGNSSFTASTTEYVIFAIRVRGTFKNTVNHREVFLNEAYAALETANRLGTVRIVLNPVMNGTVNWQYVSENTSAVEYAAPSSVQISGGREVVQTLCTPSTTHIDLQKLNLRLEAGDVLAVGMSTVANTSAAIASINWQEQ